MTLEEMRADRDRLLKARARGVRSVSVDGRAVTYTSDSEMAAALRDLEQRIAAEAGRRRGPVRVATRKGL